MRTPGHGNRRIHAVGRVDDADVGSRRAAHARTAPTFTASTSDGPTSAGRAAAVGCARIRLAVSATGPGTAHIGSPQNTADGPLGLVVQGAAVTSATIRSAGRASTATASHGAAEPAAAVAERDGIDRRSELDVRRLVQPADQHVRGPRWRPVLGAYRPVRGLGRPYSRPGSPADPNATRVDTPGTFVGKLRQAPSRSAADRNGPSGHVCR